MPGDHLLEARCRRPELRRGRCGPRERPLLSGRVGLAGPGQAGAGEGGEESGLEGRAEAGVAEPALGIHDASEFAEGGAVATRRELHAAEQERRENLIAREAPGRHRFRERAQGLRFRQSPEVDENVAPVQLVEAIAAVTLSKSASQPVSGEDEIAQRRVGPQLLALDRGEQGARGGGIRVLFSELLLARGKRLARQRLGCVDLADDVTWIRAIRTSRAP